MPGPVSADAQVNIDSRCCVEHGLYDVVGAVDVRCTDYLNVCLCGTAELTYESCNILVNVPCENGLDKEHVVHAFNGLKDAEIIDISVSIEVEV